MKGLDQCLMQLAGMIVTSGGGVKPGAVVDKLRVCPIWFGPHGLGVISGAAPGVAMEEGV
jgi:hypothetical protein